MNIRIRGGVKREENKISMVEGVVP